MLKLNRNFLFVICFILILILSGCFAKPQTKPDIKPKIKIGLILTETETETNKYLMQRFKEEAAKEKIKLITSQAQKDPNQQRLEMEKMIKEEVKAVILQPVDTVLTKDFITMLQEKNIKTLIIDALPGDIAVDGFIASDYLRAGELQAQNLVNKGSELNILILKGDKSNNITDKILQGNINILQNNSLVKKYVIKEIINWDKNNAYKVASEVFSKDSNNFNAIITHYESIASGAHRALKENNLDNIINLSTIGISQEYLSDIEAGRIFAVDTLPGLVAQISLKAAVDLINNNNWEYDLQINTGTALIPAKLTPVRIINKENLYLLQDRFKDLETQKNDTKKNEEKQQQNSDSPKQTQVKIKAKDGKEYNVTIPGEVEGIEMNPVENSDGKNE